MHKAFPGTGAIPVGVAAALQGTVVHDIARPQSHATRTYRIGHPGGTLTVGVEVAESPADVTVVPRGARNAPHVCRRLTGPRVGGKTAAPPD